VKKIIVKLALLTGMFITYKSFVPVLTNQVALTQMDNSTSSYSTFALYQNMSPFGWFTIVCFGTAMFLPELKKLKMKVGK